MIGVNGSFLASEVTGVQRYAYQLLIGLLETAPEQHIRVYAPRTATDSPLLDELRRAGADLVIAPSWARNKQVFEQVALPLMANGDAVDCLVHLSNGMCLLTRLRQAILLYDLAPVRFPRTFKPAYRAKFRSILLGAIFRRPRIATISEFSRQELESVGLKEIRVIPAGLGSPPLLALSMGTKAAMGPSELPSRMAALPNGFALVVGSSDPRKRVSEVIASWPAVYAELGLTLVVVEGASRLHASGVLPVATNGVVTLEGRVSDAELVWLMQSATVMIFASAYEGGALAAQEALALGTPVVASDIAPFRELLPSTIPFFQDFDELSKCCTDAMKCARPQPVTQSEAVNDWRTAGAELRGLIADACS